MYLALHTRLLVTMVNTRNTTTLTTRQGNEAMATNSESDVNALFEFLPEEYKTLSDQLNDLQKELKMKDKQIDDMKNNITMLTSRVDDLK